MYRLGVRVDYKYILSIILLVLSIGQLTKAAESELYELNGGSSDIRHDVLTLDHNRQRRDAPEAKNVTTPPPATTSVLNDTAAAVKTPAEAKENGTAQSNVSVTQIPLLGVNGSGILHVDVMNKNMPKVSDPIVPDDNFSDIYETPERIQSEHNITNLTIDNHDFYNSSFIGNLDFFNEHWANLSINNATVHTVLSNSHRRATSIQLSFDFPFYGHNIRNVTVATGGFIYTGEHVHNWLAATQYIAPLMANFDTRPTDDSLVKLYDDGERFTVFWENVTLQENATQKFTFAATLYKNGDIIFAYKNIPIDVQEINDKEHPVKVGISDAYLTDKIVFYVRRKTIYEYHRVSFKDHLITNNTLLKLVALPTCLPYDNCDSCLNHNTHFNCTWCPQTQKCSSGTDRNKQDWTLRRCDKTNIANVSGCAPYRTEVHSEPNGNVATGNTAYTTDKNSTITENVHETVSNKTSVQMGQVAPAPPQTGSQSTVGGVVVAFIAITLVCSLVGWIFYAFKNPHTRSGQILIKYRPSQWNWRRGEARYTAATIHM